MAKPDGAEPGPIPDFDPKKELGRPGEHPFTRGVHPTMYSGRPWTMRQYAGFADAEESNRRYRYLLKQGQTGLSIAFDLPTQMGFDPDHPRAGGEVGKAGVSIASIRDLAQVFDGIPLDKVTVSMTINATAHVLLAMLVSVAERQGVTASALGGTVQNDILKEFAARGAYIYPPGPSLRIATDVIEYCVRHMPRWNFISVSGYHIREAGSTAAQELGFTLANGIAYVTEALKRGLEVDEVGARISFFFNAHNNFFEEVAKFRAARRLWARIMKDRFKAKSDKACRLRFHTQTAGSTLTSEQPLNNVVRVTLQAMAAVLGGTQSLHTNSFDEALALPTEKAAKIALRTQQIIEKETGLTDVADPFGGSYHLETLTGEIEAAAEALIQEIDRHGGPVEAIQSGFYQSEIEKSAVGYQRNIESGKRRVVGVNAYEDEEAPSRVETLKIDEKLQKKRCEDLARLKEQRDPDAVRRALEGLRKAREGDRNLMPAVIDAVKAEATLGEVSDSLAEGFGRHEAGDLRS
jgi:methylmalonyl-CoA mutase N-terminal domain/subunit